MIAKFVEAERGRFVLLLPVAMGAAILVYFGLPTQPPLWLGLVLSGAALAALAAGWRHPAAKLAAALCLAAALGFTRAEWRTAALPPLTIVPAGAVEISGRIAGIKLLPAARRVTLAQPRLEGAAPLARFIRLRLRPDDTTQLAVGQGVQTYALLFAPERPAYPGAWDAARQDFFAGIGATGFALEPLTVTSPAPPDALGAGLQNLRNNIAQTILATLPLATGSIAVTLLTGDEQAIPAPERQNFIAAGLAHILAVAGLHVGIVMGLVFAGARFLLTRNERLALRMPAKPIAAALALLAGAGYAALTGAHLPILRSLAMASLVTFGVIIGRRAISLRGLALAAMVILLAAPESLIGVSFQMSFSAVLALISGYAAIQQAMSRLRESSTVTGRIFGRIAAIAYTSLLAGAASMPFAAYQFQQIQPYWIPANLVAVPLTGFWIMPFGLLALALMPFGLAAFALIPMGWGIAVIIWLTERIAAWPGAMLRIGPMPNSAILLIAAGLIWLCIWRSAPRLAGIALMLAGLVAYAAARPPDVLVSADARLIGIRAGAQVFITAPGKPAPFTLAAWAPVWGGVPQVLASCSQSSCRLGPVLLALTPPAGCGTALLVVSPEPLRGACPGIAFIDRVFTYQNGAAEAWIEGNNIHLRTDRQVQGLRPWVFPYPNLTTLR